MVCSPDRPVLGRKHEFDRKVGMVQTSRYNTGGNEDVTKPTSYPGPRHETILQFCKDVRELAVVSHCSFFHPFGFLTDMGVY